MFCLRLILSLLLYLHAAKPTLVLTEPPLRTRPPTEGPSFIDPNEHHPSLSFPLLGDPDRAQETVDISVGTERGWMLGAERRLHSSKNHLILADADPNVVAFNLINRELIRVAKSVEHYRNLRLKGTKEEWEAALKQGNLSDQKVKDIVNSFSWWKENVRDSADSHFAFFHKAPEGEGSPFANANYLFEPNRFSGLQKMVREERVEITLLNLALETELDRTLLSSILSNMKEKNVKLGAIDLSNAVWDAYIGRWRTARLLDLFNKQGLVTEQSRLLFTSWNPQSSGEFSPSAYSISRLLSKGVNPRLGKDSYMEMGSYLPKWMTLNPNQVGKLDVFVEYQPAFPPTEIRLKADSPPSPERVVGSDNARCKPKNLGRFSGSTLP